MVGLAVLGSRGRTGGGSGRKYGNTSWKNNNLCFFLLFYFSRSVSLSTNSSSTICFSFSAQIVDGSHHE